MPPGGSRDELGGPVAGLQGTDPGRRGPVKQNAGPNSSVHLTIDTDAKTGEFGAKDYQPVGPATHHVAGTSFQHAGIGDILGVNADDA